jgi:predicted nucleotidyltransferase
MTDQDLKIAQDLKARLAAVAAIVDFKVFGSRARGTADEYSDMDVFIEVESLDDTLKRKIRDIIWDVGFEYSMYISPLIFTRFEIENSPLRVSHIVKNIREEGIAA